MSTSQLHPEQQARERIDAMLHEAGWVIQDYSAPDFSAAPGVAVREFVTPEGPLDYLLVADRKVVGSVEAKAEGHTLRSVENQEERYNTGFKALIEKRNLPRYFDALPYQYVATGTETMFTSRRDPIRRGREVFHFHRPETLAEWAQQEHSFRARLRQMPPVKGDGLRDIQEEALKQLELSLAGDKPKALAAITMGGGKTRLAVAESYRLLRFGGAQRILFLVDRVSLGDQAEKEFVQIRVPSLSTHANAVVSDATSLSSRSADNHLASFLRTGPSRPETTGRKQLESGGGRHHWGRWPRRRGSPQPAGAEEPRGADAVRSVLRNPCSKSNPMVRSVANDRAAMTSAAQIRSPLGATPADTPRQYSSPPPRQRLRDGQGSGARAAAAEAPLGWARREAGQSAAIALGSRCDRFGAKQSCAGGPSRQLLWHRAVASPRPAVRPPGRCPGVRGPKPPRCHFA